MADRDRTLELSESELTASLLDQKNIDVLIKQQKLPYTYLEIIWKKER